MFRLVLLAFALGTFSSPADAQDKSLMPVTMQLNWHAQADFGGYFTAKAENIYERMGLDVTIKQGGPQLNIHQLLMAGQVDFVMGTQVRDFTIRNSGVPIIAVAAFYQFDPVTLMVHEGSGIESPVDLKGHPIYLPGLARINYWPWLKHKYELGDEQIRPYDPSFRALTLDKTAASQGYLTEDGFDFKKLGMSGKSLLLSDYGWIPYSSTLDTTDKLISEKPGLVEAFVKATAEGYRRFMQDPTSGIALIRKYNPLMEEAQARYTYSVMKGRGLVDPGDGVKIGSMTDARWEQAFQLLANSNVLAPDFDYKRTYTLRFIEKL